MSDATSWWVQTSLSLGTLLIAAFAAVISYWNFKNFGKTKIADFRLKWIEDLRQDVSEFYSLYYEGTLVRKDIKDSEYREDENLCRKRLREIYVRMAVLRRRILLRLKPDSDDANEQELEKLLRKVRISSDEINSSHLRQMIEITRKILKTEWNRVKTEIKIDR